MTNEQLYFAVGVPLGVNTALVLLVFWALSARITDRATTIGCAPNSAASKRFSTPA